MNKINAHKFFMIVISVVISFSIVSGLTAWLILKNTQTEIQDTNIENYTDDVDSHADSSNQKSTAAEVPTLANPTLTNQSNQIGMDGQVNIKQINNIIEEQKYTLMSKGVYITSKINNFLNKNIERLLPSDCSLISYKLADLDNDGFDEIGLMYEKVSGNNSFLMVSALRWSDGQVAKDIDTLMRVNDYDNNVEITAGDIIPGGNAEFSFIQKDLTGKRGSKIKIALLLSSGFKDYYNSDAGSEIQVGDFDGDGKLELYTTSLNTDGSKNLTWSRWQGAGFVEYQTTQEPPEGNAMPENTLQQQSY